MPDGYFLACFPGIHFFEKMATRHRSSIAACRFTEATLYKSSAARTLSPYVGDVLISGLEGSDSRIFRQIRLSSHATGMYPTQRTMHDVSTARAGASAFLFSPIRFEEYAQAFLFQQRDPGTTTANIGKRLRDQIFAAVAHQNICRIVRLSWRLCL